MGGPAEGAGRVLRVGLIKAVPQRWNLTANWACFEELATYAKRRGAQLVCTPECFLDGYVTTDSDGWTPERFRDISQSLCGDNYVLRAMNLARELQMYTVFGFTELAEDGSYNAAALIDDHGQLLGCYHKTHLRAHDKRYLPGQGLPVWHTPLADLGIIICADRNYPETARTLKVQGASLILVPSYGSWDLDNEWRMRTRSCENEVFMCFVHPHVALITGPRGEVAAIQQSNLPDVLIHRIEMIEFPDPRFPTRRPDIYKL